MAAERDGLVIAMMSDVQFRMLDNQYRTREVIMQKVPIELVFPVLLVVLLFVAAFYLLLFWQG